MLPDSSELIMLENHSRMDGSLRQCVRRTHRWSACAGL